MSAGMHIPFFKPSFSEDEEKAVVAILRSGWLTTGKETLSFEHEFAEYVSATHALAVNSASSGLMLAMDAFGVTRGKKILTTPYTFVSTATSALHLGAEVVYADIEKNSYSIDPQGIEDALKKDSSICAIVPVHVAGNLCDMKTITEVARRFDVAVIEDAAHSFPSKTQKGFAGTLGDAGVFSFYATKTITTGEGGMIVLSNTEKAQRISMMRSHGIDRSVWDRYTSNKASWEYDVVDEGWKCNLPDILATIGRVQLTKAHSFYEKRMKHALRYSQLFSSYDFLQIPPDGEGNAWHLYLLRIVPERLSVHRNIIAKELQDEGIGISMHFIPHFNLSFLQKRYNLRSQDFPNAHRQGETTISLPLWPDMTDEMVERVVEVTIKICTKYLARS